MNTSECILYKNKSLKNGYGRAWWKGKTILAHQVVWIKNFGEMAIGKEIHHLCGNKLCLNPDHLTAVTRKEHRKIHGLSGVGLINSRRTMCKNGHDFDGHDKKQRTCSICRRQILLRYSKRRREGYYVKGN